MCRSPNHPLNNVYGVLMTTATRRFSARPFDVLLLATGYFYLTPGGEIAARDIGPFRPGIGNGIGAF
jgi:hypothetical protein